MLCPITIIFLYMKLMKLAQYNEYLISTVNTDGLASVATVLRMHLRISSYLYVYLSQKLLHFNQDMYMAVYDHVKFILSAGVLPVVLC